MDTATTDSGQVEDVRVGAAGAAGSESARSGGAPRKARRVSARFVVLCLLLGMMTSVAVAWLLAAAVRLDVGSRGYVAIDGDHLQPWFLTVRRTGASRTVWYEKGRVYSKQGVGPAGASGAAVSSWSFATNTRTNQAFVIDAAKVSLPQSLMDRVKGAGPGDWWGVALDRRGWPMPAVEVVIGAPMDPAATETFVYEWGLPLDEVLKRTLGGSRTSMFSTAALPIRPVPLGLAADTVLYAAAWAALLYVPISIRAAMRKKQHECPNCGYDLSGTPAGMACPECGIGRAGETDGASRVS